MLKSKLDGKDIWVRNFEIPESKKHKKGFTVYKVVSTVFPRNYPEGATKITVWKRYKEFKALHRELEGLFYHLYLSANTTFPVLPKDNFFRRFDPQVIEDRRRSALELLEFSSTYSQLFTNKIFVKFFEDGHYPRDFVDVTNLESDEANLNVRVEAEDVNFEDCLVPEKVWKPKESPDDDDSSPSFSGGSPEPSSPILTNEFLPLDQPVDNATAITSNDIKPQAPQKPNVVTFSDAASSSHHNNQSNGTTTNLNLTLTTISDTVPAPYSLQETKNCPFMGSSASLNDDFNFLEEEFDFCRNESAIPNSASTLSLNTCVESQPSTLQKAKHLRKYSGFNLFDFLPIFTKKHSKAVDDRNLSQSLSSYIREAAGFISVAHNHESNMDYSAALDSYSDAIQVLLEGAQGDQDSERRALVKRKVEKYLSHAEKLKQKSIGNESQVVFDSLASGDGCSSSNDSHGGEDSFVVLNSNVMPSSIDELKNYKVVGSTYNNILVAVDITAHGGPNCFAIKVLRKSPLLLDPEKPSLIPSAIPFMVQLLKWFNTEDSIVLILQYAAGGRLLDFVQSYQTKEMTIPEVSDDEKVTETILSTTNPNQSLTLIEAGDSTCWVNRNSNNFHINADDSGLNDGRRVVKQELNFEPPIQLGIVDNGSLRTLDRDLETETEDLIESSRALLKIVSKTLETQKKTNLDPVSLQAEEETPSTSHFPTLNSNSNEMPSTFMTTSISSKSKFDDINGEDILPTRTIPERCVKIWTAELVIALDKLHSQGITYGDLDVHNILLGDNGHILLSYRALWNEVDSKSESNDFSAPEVFNGLGKALWKTHPSADWWSLGCIVFYLLTGLKLREVHPEGVHPQTIICVPSTNRLGEFLSSEAKTFLIELLQFTPNLRLGYYGGAEEIKSHPFFAEFDWKVAESSNFSLH